MQIEKAWGLRAMRNVPLLQAAHVFCALLRIGNHFDEEICKSCAAELCILAPVQVAVVYRLLVRGVP